MRRLFEEPHQAFHVDHRTRDANVGINASRVGQEQKKATVLTHVTILLCG